MALAASLKRSVPSAREAKLNVDPKLGTCDKVLTEALFAEAALPLVRAMERGEASHVASAKSIESY